MKRVALEEPILLVSQFLDVFGQVGVEFSKACCQERAQRGHLTLLTASR